MDSLSDHELVGGPYDGHAIKATPGERLPLTLWLPLEAPGASRRVAKYVQVPDGDFHFAVELEVRDPILAALDLEPDD